MTTFAQRVCTGFFILVISGPVAAEWYYDGKGWLERMASAMTEMSYQGTFVYVQGDSVETMRLTHVNDEGGVRERMYSVSGPVREIIRDSEGVRCVLGDQEPLMADALVSGAMFPKFPVDIVERKDSRYLLKTGPENRIAGHMGRKLTILPRDEFRYGYDIWLEVNTGLLLRWVLYDADRNILAKLMFTDFKYGQDVDLAELEPNASEKQFQPVKSIASGNVLEGSEARDKQPPGLPAGFQIAAFSDVDRRSNQSFEHLVFSDGLATVSVYIERITENLPMRPGLSKVGTTNAYSTTAGGMNIMAIGDVPAVTVKKIGNAFIDPLLASE